MSDLAQNLAPLHLKPGRHNMASGAFAELRAARMEGREPEGGGLSFGDLLDTVTPLPHVPVASEIYRHLAGDRIGPEARVAGGLLYGGPIGAVASVFSLAVTGNNEEGVGDRLFASIAGSEPAAEAEPVIAAIEAPSDEMTTAAVRAPAPSPSPLARTASAPALPRLSPDAFEALLGSFADPAAVQEANRTLIPDGDTPDEEPPAPVADAGLMRAMQQAMDKYDALKASAAQ